MTSLRRFPHSKFYYACFTMPDGRRVQRSTKLTARKAAQARAEEFERATREARTASQAQRVIADIYKARTGESLQTATVRAYIEGWLKRKQPECAPASFAAYRGHTSKFLRLLGGKAELPIQDVSRETILAFRDSESSRVGPSSVNHAVKVLRMVFEDARRDGVLADNPATAVKLIKAEKHQRRPFTLPEMKAILQHCDEEWRSMLLFGFYTGQRLGDIARLTWQNVDLVQGELRLVTRKTGRVAIIPLSAMLLELLGNSQGADDPKAPLHPRAAETIQRTGKTTTLSRQFGEILASAGLTAGAGGHEGRGIGRGAKRQLSDISFHALRHTATSLMKAAGAGLSVVMDLIGHESAAVSAHYTHTTLTEKKKAIDSIPSLH